MALNLPFALAFPIVLAFFLHDFLFRTQFTGFRTASQISTNEVLYRKRDREGFLVTVTSKKLKTTLSCLNVKADLSFLQTHIVHVD